MLQFWWSAAKVITLGTALKQQMGTTLQGNSKRF